MNRKPIQLKGNWMIGSYINAQPMRMKGESLTSLWEDEMFEGSPWKLPTLHGWLLPIFWSSKMNKHYLRMKNLASYSHQPLLTMLISYMWVSYLNLLVWYAFIWSDKSTLFFFTRCLTSPSSHHLLPSALECNGMGADNCTS